MDRLKALLAVMNSIAFEVQVRALLATAHISLGVVRRVFIPDLTNRRVVLSLSSWVDKCLSGDLNASIDFEVAVAKAYGIAKRRFRQLLTFFPLLPQPQVNTCQTRAYGGQKLSSAESQNLMRLPITSLHP